MTYKWIDLEDYFQGGVLRVDWPAELDLLFTNQAVLGPTRIWISPTTGAYWKLMVVGEA
jgi:hypothetical protein